MDTPTLPGQLPGSPSCATLRQSAGDPSLLLKPSEGSPLQRRRIPTAALPSIRTCRTGIRSPTVSLQGDGVAATGNSLSPAAWSPHALTAPTPSISQSPLPACDPNLPASGVSRLRIHVATYNMAGNLPSQLPMKFFGEAGPQADLFVVGTQESCALGDWEKLVVRSLGRSYVKKAQESLLSISLLVFARTSVEDRLTAVRTSSIACGVGNLLGNKGAVGVSCVVDGARLLFIASHLAAHDEFIERRNADYNRIYQGLFSTAATSGNVDVPATPGGGGSGTSTPPLSESSPRHMTGVDAAAHFGGGLPSIVSRLSRLAHVSSMSQIPQLASPQSSARQQDANSATSSSVGTPVHVLSQSCTPRGGGVAPTDLNSSLQRFAVPSSPERSALPQHDVVVWAGDLNYRINGTQTAIKHLLDKDMIEVLHANDQLRIQMRKGKVFQGFHEQAIHFPPTFKFNIGSSCYSDKRVPSWTDRILHTAYAHEHVCCLEPLYYRSVDSLRDSDHRAVVAGYDLNVSCLLCPSGAGQSAAKKKGACTVS